MVHLPNGVDARRFSWRRCSGCAAAFQRTPLVILVVGRIDPQKNQLLAARLLAEVLLEKPRAHLVLVGPVTNADYNLSLSMKSPRSAWTATLAGFLRARNQ